MRSNVSRVLDFLTSEPLRIRSILRLVLIVLIALLIYQTHVSHWLDEVFTAVLVLYAIGSLAWLVYVVRRPVKWWFRYASMFVDVAVVTALCIASGPGTISLYPIFFLLPISVAFLDSPAITGALPPLPIEAVTCCHSSLAKRAREMQLAMALMAPVQIITALLVAARGVGDKQLASGKTKSIGAKVALEIGKSWNTYS